MIVTANNNEKTDPVLTSPENGGRKRLLWWFTSFIFGVGLIFTLIWVFYWQYHQKTDDAYANGNLISINSVVEGSVIAFYADDTDLVKEGQLLVQLDPTYYQFAYDRSLDALAAEALHVRQLYDTVLVNQSALEMKRASVAKARYDYENRSTLVGAKAISNEDYTHARDDLDIAEHAFKMAEAQLKVSIDAIGTSSFADHPLIEEKKNAVREAYYNLKHTAIYAPATGYVAKRSVNVGQWVVRNRNLMSLIPTDYVWVDANFKETQLKNMRIGQPATVWFDLYGSSVKYEGKVLGIASGSGSVFSLIPPQNATGNWIKIVQRLPVRISLDPETVKKYPVRLGISAEVDVDISDQTLPMMAEKTQTTPIAKTDAYQIDLSEVDLVIQKIIDQQEMHE